MRVLVVDDVMLTRLSIRALLGSAGAISEVREATDGREAVATVAQWQPDTVVMDVQMTRLDGLAATRLIKARWPGIRVVVISADDRNEAAARLAGANAFVCKADPPDRLLDVLIGGGDLTGEGSE